MTAWIYFSLFVLLLVVLAFYWHLSSRNSFE